VQSPAFQSVVCGSFLMMDTVTLELKYVCLQLQKAKNQNKIAPIRPNYRERANISSISSQRFIKMKENQIVSIFICIHPRSLSRIKNIYKIYISQYTNLQNLFTTDTSLPPAHLHTAQLHAPNSNLAPFHVSSNL